MSAKLNCRPTRLSPPRRARLGSAAVSAAPVGARMCLARGEHEPQACRSRFRRRESVWSAATCRRFFPRAQAKPPGTRPCREQKRQQAGALQTLARDTGRVQRQAFGHTLTLTRYPSPRDSECAPTAQSWSSALRWGEAAASMRGGVGTRPPRPTSSPDNGQPNANLASAVPSPRGRGPG